MKRRPPFSSPFLHPDADDPGFGRRDAGHAHEPEPHSQDHGSDAHHGQNRTGQRVHEAYAARENMSAFSPENRGPLGGLFPEGTAPEAPAGGTAIDDETLDALCKMRICPQCPEKKEADESRLRALADLDNARKRMAREHEEQIRFAAEAVLSDIIPALDNLDLALKHAAGNTACKDFITGVHMTRNLMLESLKKHGLHLVGEVGQEFTPTLHEAVGMTCVEGIADGHICALLSHGYTLNGRLLRPARVMVCKKDA